MAHKQGRGHAPCVPSKLQERQLQCMNSGFLISTIATGILAHPHMHSFALFPLTGAMDGV